MRLVSLAWPILLGKCEPFCRVKCHHFRIYAYGVSPLRMVIGFGCAVNLNRRYCANHHFVDFAVIELRQVMICPSCPMLLTKYERCDHLPFHYRLHDRMEAIQNLQKNNKDIFFIRIPAYTLKMVAFKFICLL